MLATRTSRAVQDGPAKHSALLRSARRSVSRSAARGHIRTPRLSSGGPYGASSLGSAVSIRTAARKPQ